MALRTVDPLAAVPVPGQNSAAFRKLAQGTDTEQSELLPDAPPSVADQALLDQQLPQAEQAAMRFPTVASAKAAEHDPGRWHGPRRRCPLPALNASSLKGVNPDGTINAPPPRVVDLPRHRRRRPGRRRHVRVAVRQGARGFAGPNDHWHQHSNLCIQFDNGQIKVPFAPDSNVTPQQCAAVHGDFMRRRCGWCTPGSSRAGRAPRGLLPRQPAHLLPGNTYLVDPLGFCLRQS